MEMMSEDEVLIMMFCVILAGCGWIVWYYRLLCVASLGRDLGNKWFLAVIPPFCLACLYVLLKNTASYDVRDSSIYLFFYMVMGAAWLLMGRWIFPFLGILWRDDALESRNTAAGTLIGMAFLGLTACYAGANVGDGPGWWCVVFAGGIATLVWFFLWAVLQGICDLSEMVTVERDSAAAFRFGAYLLASGIICGRGAAGDWTSAAQTIAEFRVAWPVLILAIAAGAVEFWYARRPTGSYCVGASAIALLLAVVYLGFAVWFLTQAGPLPQNPIYDQ